VARCWDGLPERPGGPSGALVERLEAKLREQERALDATRVSTAAAVRAFDDWCDQVPPAGADGDTAYWWLKGAAVLSWPVMPEFGQRIWAGLGGSDEPRLAAFAAPTPPLPGATPPRFARPTVADLAPCLPETLAAPASVRP
jgi:methionyl-tRNA synthetase